MRSLAVCLSRVRFTTRGMPDGLLTDSRLLADLHLESYGNAGRGSCGERPTDTRDVGVGGAHGVVARPVAGRSRNPSCHRAPGRTVPICGGLVAAVGAAAAAVHAALTNAGTLTSQTERSARLQSSDALSVASIARAPLYWCLSKRHPACHRHRRCVSKPRRTRRYGAQPTGACALDTPGTNRM